MTVLLRPFAKLEGIGSHWLSGLSRGLARLPQPSSGPQRMALPREGGVLALGGAQGAEIGTRACGGVARPDSGGHGPRFLHLGMTAPFSRRACTLVHSAGWLLSCSNKLNLLYHHCYIPETSTSKAD